MHLRCPNCGAWEGGDDRAATCSFCTGALPWAYRPRRQASAQKGLIWGARAYRQSSLLVFAGAIVELHWLANVKAFFFGSVVLLPFTEALWLAHRTRNAWIIAFLVLVDLGVILAPAHQIFPWLNMFPEIPRTLDSSVISCWSQIIFRSTFHAPETKMIERVDPGPRSCLRFLRLSTRGLIAVVLAIGAWLGRIVYDAVRPPSFAATGRLAGFVVAPEPPQ
jgi:hypothetical protein